MAESKPVKAVRDVMENMRMTDMPLETIAYQCFLAQLSNPVKNEYRTEFAVLAKRSFDAAEAFCQEAWNQKKGKKV